MQECHVAARCEWLQQGTHKTESLFMLDHVTGSAPVRLLLPSSLWSDSGVILLEVTSGRWEKPKSLEALVLVGTIIQPWTHAGCCHRDPSGTTARMIALPQ